ncbi:MULTISPECIES: DUF3558 family protein [unclassified Dietzia]|uniref:DUF3558 family protein n=1 Tax=unclassified Dietzia TaxID=2617939 RepID=UPI0015F7A856|nr:DUF3558 family protein [Dietzia sp. DQ12-76]MBB1025048.1 DUF3558 family protein [Dietzia sp. DQ12-76]MBB1027361.1 DUF3558 family protein [Dietzia sp. DQ11-38-2]
MRTIRGAVAAFAALAVVSACGVGQDGDRATTSSAVTEEPGNPWDLPIEQRPPLFDPCAEIPIEAVEEGVGGPVEEVEEYTRHNPGEMMVCGWASDEVDISVLATWKSREEYLADASFEVLDEAPSGGRNGLRLTEVVDAFDSSCIQLFFTSRGTAWVRFDLVTGLNEFRGRPLTNACDALDKAIRPIMTYIPKGDFR